LNEQDLLTFLQRGDPQAFKQLVDTWQHMVFNTVLGIIQDMDEAEDITQEVFIQVYQSVHGFRAESRLSTWLYRIAVTKALDAERKKKAKKRMGVLRSLVGWGEKEEPVTVFHHPGIQMEKKEAAALLFKALQGLPENQRIAFTLIKTEGLAYEEVATIMQISLKAVEALMHRAKEHLRKQLRTYYNS
jgi:RNA polymerase sigma factor (sigma-70 family)